MLASTTKELLRFAREVVKDLKSEPKNLNLVASALESYQKSKSMQLSLRTELEQEIYLDYSMALDVYDFEINDFVKIVYWLQKSNYCINKQIAVKLCRSIPNSARFLSSESWFMLLNILTINNYYFRDTTTDMILNSIEKLQPPSDEWLVQALFDLCCLNKYDEPLWRKLISFSTGSHFNDIEKLRIIKYAVSTEGLQRVGNVILVALELMIDDALSKVTQNIAKPSLINIGLLSVNKMQREVDFVLKTMMDYETNVNISDAYLVDFYNKNLNLGFDLYGPSHFLIYDYHDKQEALDNESLIPSIKLKQNLLKKNKIRIGSISFVEWNRFVDQTEKMIFLKKKLRLLKIK
jgi:hypothetical protein